MSGEFLFKPGESRLYDVPVTSNGVPMRASLEVSVNPELHSKSVGQGARGQLVIEQILKEWLGEIVVNSVRFTYLFNDTTMLPAISSDTIRLLNQQAGDQPSVVADWKQFGAGDCTRDLVLDDPNQVFPLAIGNAVTDPACNSEVSIFSKCRGLSYQPNPYPWTAAFGQEYAADLPMFVTVPVRVRTIWDPNTTSPVETDSHVLSDFLTANSVFENNRVGIRFDHDCDSGCTSLWNTNPTGDQDDPNTWNTCPAMVDNIKNNPDAFSYDHVNVFYVRTGLNAKKGEHCGHASPSDPRIIFVTPRSASATTLAHEFAHALGLTPANASGHVTETTDFNEDGIPDFGTTNIMLGHSYNDRNEFTLGQAFRMTVYPASVVNVLSNVRTGLTQYCEPRQGSKSSDVYCPSLALGRQIQPATLNSPCGVPAVGGPLPPSGVQP